MFSKILIGVDGEEGGRDALALARSLADPHAELVLVYVWKRIDGVFAAALGRTPPGEVGTELLRRVSWSIPERTRIITTAADSVAEGLHRTADAEGCDLLVVGAHLVRGSRLAAGGDDARASLHDAPCAVAVAPHGFADDHGTPARLGRIGVAYRPTPEGRAAYHAAHELAQREHADLRAIEVIQCTPSPFAGPYAALQLLEDVTGELERAARARLEKLGDARPEIRRGSSVEELVDASSSLDLLVLGSRAYGPVRRLLLGSTSDGVLAGANCAVLVLPRPAVIEHPEPDVVEEVTA
jgi:nucleotide-binding universal stress UspA family protein